MPPSGTRPNMSAEWERTIQWANQLGLMFLHKESQALSYHTPPFEQNALRADGFTVAATEWRRGDLAVFQCIQPCTAPRPPAPPIEGPWEDVAIAGIHIRLRQQIMDDFIDPLLHPLIDGDILPSVSRRDSRRRLVDVWTVGNRVFTCRGTHIFKHIVRAVAKGISPCDAVAVAINRKLQPAEVALVDQTTQQIYQVVAREIQDIEVWMRNNTHDNQSIRRLIC